MVFEEDLARHEVEDHDDGRGHELADPGGDAELVHAVMTDERMWGMDLTGVSGFEKAVCEALAVIRKSGAKKAFARCLNG